MLSDIRITWIVDTVYIQRSTDHYRVVAPGEGPWSPVFDLLVGTLPSPTSHHLISGGAAVGPSGRGAHIILSLGERPWDPLVVGLLPHIISSLGERPWGPLVVGLLSHIISSLGERPWGSPGSQPLGATTLHR